MAAAPSKERRLPLEQAAWYHAPPSLKREFDALLQQDAPPFEQWDLSADDAVGRFQKAMAKLQPVFDRMTARGNIKIQAHDLLLSALQDGSLVATGFPAHARNAYGRVRVEPFMFQESYVDWGRSSCKGLDRNYQLVEVFRPTPARIIPAPASAHQLEKRSVGRPNIRNDVVELTIELLESRDPPEWTRRVDLQEPVRHVGMKKYPEKFDHNRPKREVLRVGINEALKLRPDLNRPQKL
jgi:hypothetical protein